MKKLISLLIITTLFLALPKPVQAVSISNITSNSSSVPVYNKYELKFDVSTTSSYPFLEYTTTPPPGVAAGIGISVEGIFTANGKTWTQPAFYMTETTQSGSATNPVFSETNKKYWVVRFSPLEQGTYSVQLRATDASGTTTVSAGTFTATAPTRDGFIKVSQADKRYFEFSNGKIYWPLGPVYGDEDFTKFKDSGINWTRDWLGGSGMYSANWARWKSSSEQHGNEGIGTWLAFLNSSEKYPGSDGLAYDLQYTPGNTTARDARNYWLTGWMDESFYTKLKPNTTYQIKLTAKTVGITGPSNSAYPYGLVVKFNDSVWNSTGPDYIENAVRNSPKPFNHIVSTQGTNGWQTFQTSYTTPSNVGSDIYILLDNTTGGHAYIYELSIKDSTGAELVRNPNADMHMYIEQRPAASLDLQVAKAEANGIYMQLNVHDKNDPLFRSLNTDGTWAAWLQGPGYNQAYNTKSSWLKRQYYRYLIARWSYSPSVFAFEDANENDPNDSFHWDVVQQNFAHYMKSIATRPVMTISSFWCCSLNDGFKFFSNYQGKYPDIDFVDLHEYSGNPNTTSSRYTTDVAEWVKQVGEVAYTKNAGKPLIWAENGLSSITEYWAALNDTRITSSSSSVNSGVWYHNMLWPQLTRGAAFVPGYWFYSDTTAEGHKVPSVNNTGRQSMSKPFYNFIQDIDYHKGGYVDSAATSTNTKIRTYGQKKSDLTKAFMWIQNSDSEWDKVPTAQTATLTILLKPSTSYTTEWWNTYTGVITQTTSSTTNSSGNLTLNISSLTTDQAVKIYQTNQPTPTITPIPPTSTPIPPTATPTPLPRPCPLLGDTNSCDGVVNALDFTFLSNNFGSTNSKADLNNDGSINALDFTILSNNFGKSI